MWSRGSARDDCHIVIERWMRAGGKRRDAISPGWAIDVSSPGSCSAHDPFFVLARYCVCDFMLSTILARNALYALQSSDDERKCRTLV
jgi:hypothetical protein